MNPSTFSTTCFYVKFLVDTSDSRFLSLIDLHTYSPILQNKRKYRWSQWLVHTVDESPALGLLKLHFLLTQHRNQNLHIGQDFHNELRLLQKKQLLAIKL